MINFRTVCSLGISFMLREVKYRIIRITLLINFYHFFLVEEPLLFSLNSSYDFSEISVLSLSNSPVLTFLSIFPSNFFRRRIIVFPSLIFILTYKFSIIRVINSTQISTHFFKIEIFSFRTDFHWNIRKAKFFDYSTKDIK